MDRAWNRIPSFSLSLLPSLFALACLAVLSGCGGDGEISTAQPKGSQTSQAPSRPPPAVKPEVPAEPHPGVSGTDEVAPPALPPRATARGPEAADPGSSDARRERYLELVLEQLRRLERAIGGLGPSRHAAGVLAASALAASGHEGFDGRSNTAEAARHAEALLAKCAGGWHRGDCPRAQIPLQRALLQYPEMLASALPAERLAVLRREAATGAPPPPESEIEHPWSFRETENQRAVRMARSLVGQALAGTPDSPTARGWTRFTEAFLLAHERDGWYEQESPGYLPISMTALLLLADHAPDERVRQLAIRHLHLLFAAWAQDQVGGYPAGAKSRAYVHWSLSDGNVPWRAWAWLLAGMGEPRTITFRDWADLATTVRYRVPEAVVHLLAGRRSAPPYEIRERRRITPARRVELDVALTAWATPDSILGCSQAVEGLRLRVSGSHRIVVTLYPETVASAPARFAPVYLWSRTANPRGEGEGGTRGWTGDDLAVCHEDVALAELGEGHGGGHVYLAPPWGEPELVDAEAERNLAVARYGDTWLALATTGGWEVAQAVDRFPALYTDRRTLGGAWVLVARLQPAKVALVVGHRREGSFETFRARIAGERLTVGETGWIRFADLAFLPGRRATVAGKALDPRRGTLLDAPFLARTVEGGWRFRWGETRYDLQPVEAQISRERSTEEP